MCAESASESNVYIWERWRSPLQRGLTYLGIDLLLFPFNLLAAWLLTQVGLHYAAATVAGFFLQLTAAFFMNKRWTFEERGVTTRSGLLKTYAIGASDLCIAVLITALCVEYVGLNFLLARIAAGIVVFVWDYILNSLLTFKTKPFS